MTEYPGTIFCPECNRPYTFTPSEFVQHREQAHQPVALTVAVAGIQSREAHGYQPETQED